MVFNPATTPFPFLRISVLVLLLAVWLDITQKVSCIVSSNIYVITHGHKQLALLFLSITDLVGWLVGFWCVSEGTVLEDCTQCMSAAQALAACDCGQS